MYIPASFHETDRNKLRDFMRRHSFATLVSHAGSEPLASHLPLLLERDSGPYGRLIGHMARANPQWHGADGQRVLAIFHGPHAYISPTWYEARDVVPTWNYVTVHAYGVLRLPADRDRLRDVLCRMVSRYESGMPRPWTMQSLDADFIERMLDALVGFEIDLDRLEGKWKLNQNHPLERQQKVIRALRATGDHEGVQIAEWMADGQRED